MQREGAAMCLLWERWSQGFPPPQKFIYPHKYKWRKMETILWSRVHLKQSLLVPKYHHLLKETKVRYNTDTFLEVRRKTRKEEHFTLSRYASMVFRLQSSKQSHGRLLLRQSSDSAALPVQDTALVTHPESRLVRWRSHRTTNTNLMTTRKAADIDRLRICAQRIQSLPLSRIRQIGLRRSWKQE